MRYSYSGSIYHNRVLIIENGKAVKYNTIYHYDIPDIIFNYITDGKYCLGKKCDFLNNKEKINIDKTKYYDKYMKIIAHAMG